MAPEQKSKLANIPCAGPQRGWSQIGAETTALLREENLQGAPLGSLTDEKVCLMKFPTEIPTMIDTNCQEHFDCGPPDDQEFPNRWPDPDDLPGFRDFMDKYYKVGQQVSLDIIKVCELGLDLPKGTLERKCIPAASEIRLVHYPPSSIENFKSGHTKRCWPHSDFGIISLLFQDSVGGLELEDRIRPGSFVPVLNESPYEMVVNTSDTFQRWTNRVIQAGIHQVTSPRGMMGSHHDVLPERYSAVFFFKAHRETSVGPLPQFVGPQKPALYRDITALEFQQQRTRKVY
jgi:isopenicillin N synthase-like dioxygenase